jgi:threonine aldolase
MIDLRSDTVTQPTDEMRAAMAAAEVGDDGYGDDPTVRRLEELGAELLGKEAAVFVPSGTFGNQLALFTWCRRGEEVILGEECHIIQHEAGAAAVIAGVQTRTIPAPDGVIKAAAINNIRRGGGLQEPQTALLCLENAHSSGNAVSLTALDAAYQAAKTGDGTDKPQAIPVHLDGARIFNAAAALGVTAAEIAARSDSVMCCLSKGLCAPAGSLLAGHKDFAVEARRKRKIMGGGMRQTGVLAAAGLVALTRMRDRLQEDHERAKRLALALDQIPAISVQQAQTPTNMVFFQSRQVRTEEDSRRVVQLFKNDRILINGADRGVFRFVTHYWINDEDIDAVIAASARHLSEKQVETT